METVFTGGTESYTLVYLYDEHGSPIGLRYRTPSYSAGVFDGYFFEKNIQGDITGIWDQNGTKVVSTGMTYSAGFVDNFLKPDDYANHFIDINAGYSYGIDHCFNPEYLYGCTTRATSLSFGSGINYGVGYDYYFAPWTIAKWGTNNEI